MIRLTLPYPPKELNPNQKVHWAVKAKHAKLCRSIAKGIAIQYKGDVPIGDLVLDLNFYPPDNRRRDDDNAIASIVYSLISIHLLRSTFPNNTRFSDRCNS